MSPSLFGTTWRLLGAPVSSPSSPAAQLPSRQSIPHLADPSSSQEVVVVPPPSQFAAWSELLQGPAPPKRSTTFSSISSASCTSCAHPDTKKIRSQDSIRSAVSVRPVPAVEAEASTSYSSIPNPKAVKTKLRSKSKSSKEANFDKIFLAQELNASPSASTSKFPSEALSLSLVQTESFAKPCQDARRKRARWIPRRSTSPNVKTVHPRRSVDLTAASPPRSSSDCSSVEHHNPDTVFRQEGGAYAQRARVDRQLSFCSRITTASSSSNASDTLMPTSPVMSAVGHPSDLTDLPDGTKMKKSKSASYKRKTYALQFSLDGRYLAAAGSDHVIRVYEVISSPAERAEEVEAAQSHRFEEACHKKCPSASPQNSPIAPQLAPVFKANPVRVFAGHTGDVMDISWSKNNFLLSCSSDKTAKLWHPNRPDCLCTFATSATVSCIDFHPADDRFFVTGGLDGKLRLWNISACRVQSINDVPGVITAVAFSASGAAVCVGTHAGSLLTFSCSNALKYLNAVTIKSAAAGKNTQASKITSFQPVKLCDEFAGGGEFMTVTSNDSRVRIYSIASRKLVSRLKSATYLNKKSQIRATGSSDSQFVVSGSEDASIHVWSLASTSSGPSSLLPSSLFGVKRGKVVKENNSAEVGDNSTWWSWQAASGCVRCAIFAPAATSDLLALAEDPLENKTPRHGLRSRLIVSTDDSGGLKVWRTDPRGQLI